MNWKESITFQLNHSLREILLHVLWNHLYLTKSTLQRFDDQVPIITLEVMYGYRQLPTRFGYPIPEITLVMCSTTIASYNVTMTSHFIISKRFCAYMPGSSVVKRSQLCSSKKHSFWSSNVLVKQLFSFLLQIMYKLLNRILVSIHDKWS